ncbi:MAG: hypothetical protein IGS50_03115 [Synechococcales cyanobacterium C42_A2020_086]|jgi:hypothetical protein|nr:hypothetical protein [Synechococcales cyanobacterium C42_A2020_086]
MLKLLLTAALFLLGVGYSSAAAAQAPRSQTAQTYAPDEETIVGGRDVEIPSRPVLPIYYTLPMEISIVQDSSITSDTPILDSATDVPTWGEAVLECLKSSPVLVRQTPAGEVPFTIEGQEGTIKLNANGKPVCQA